MEKVMNNKIKRLLSSFDENQIAEINNFLNSADGRRFKNNISDKDKNNILRQLDNMDTEKLRHAFSNISKDDIIRMLNQRK